MRKEEFYFDSRDNQSKIHAVRYLPDSENVVGIVQIIHGMSEYVERYEGFAHFLTDRSLAVVGEDHLGHGKSVGEGQIRGYICKQDPATVVVRDSHRLKKLTQEMYPGVPYIIAGHSMGSFMLRNYISRYGTGIDGAIIMGTGMQSWGLLTVSKITAAFQKRLFGERHISKLIYRGAFGSYNKKIANPKTMVDWITKDTEIIENYIADDDCGFPFTVNGFQTLFELISRAKKKENIKNIPKELPILMISGGDDPVGEYGKAVKRAYNSLTQAGVKNVTMKLYEADRHELLNETNKEQVMEDIYAWIAKVLSALDNE